MKCILLFTKKVVHPQNLTYQISMFKVRVIDTIAGILSGDTDLILSGDMLTLEAVIRK